MVNSQNSGPAFLGQTPKAFFQPIQAAQKNVMFVGSNIYALQYKSGSGGANINGSAIFKSTDGGTTWKEQDSAHSPNSDAACIFYDKLNNQLIVALVPVTFPQSSQNIFLNTYSFATDTWGVSFAAGGPTAVTTVQAVYKRPDGTIFVIYDIGAGNNGAGTSRLRGTYWNGVMWSASIDIGAALIPLDATGNIVGSTCASDMDTATGNISIAYGNSANNKFFYQLILANNTLGASTHFGFTALGDNAFGTLIVTPNGIFITAVDSTFTNNLLLVATNLAAPAFTLINPANMQFPGGFLNAQGAIAWDGKKLYWEINFFDPTFFTYVGFKLFTSTDNGNTWAIVPDNATEPFFYDFTPGQSPVAPNADPTFGVNGPFMVLNVPGKTIAYVFGTVRNTVAGIFLGYAMNSESFGATTKALLQPFPRPLPRPVGVPRHTEGKHLFLR